MAEEKLRGKLADFLLPTFERSIQAPLQNELDLPSSSRDNARESWTCSATMDEIDRVLAGWREGDRRAFDDLFHLVYDELRVLAGRRLRHVRSGDTLGPTALVHEVYLRFADRSSPNLLDRSHFVALAARAMRMIVVDHWRRKHSQKRDPQAPVSLRIENVPARDGLSAFDVVALDDALRKLSELDVRQGKIVELRFFGGLTLDEIAVIFAVSERTVKREWQKARAFLYDAMRSSQTADV